MYGAVDGPPGDDPAGGDRGGMRHVCFCSFEVEGLVDGEKYY
jgi:hypothetical protein